MEIIKVNDLKALIFDLDGTLADTLPLCLKSFQDSIEISTGIRPSKDLVERFWGFSEHGIIKNLDPVTPEKSFDIWKKTYQENHKNYCDLFDGIRKLLETLKKSGVLLFLVTGKGEVSCGITLEKLQIENLFQEVKTGSENGSIKPQCIKEILEKYNLSPAEVLYIGDAPTDITDAKSVGVDTIAAAWAKSANIEAILAQNPYKICYSVDEFINLVDFLLNNSSKSNV